MPRNDGYVYRERIGEDSKGQRVLAYLSERYRHSSPSEWTARIEAGDVLVEAVRAAAEQALHPGQELAWRRPPWSEPDAPLEYAVLLEDEDLIAVAKPAGLPTLAGAGFLQSTLLHQVRRRVPGATAVHRLGRWTSGIVLFARTPSARAELARQMAGREIGKGYRALASGNPSWDAISIATPIGPVPHPWLGSVHAATAGGKPASSAVRVLERRSGAFLCDVRIATGRPHQIRIHLAAAGHPLVGDPLYAPGGIPAADTAAVPGDPGYLLHAAELTFRHPGSGLPVSVTCPPPPELRCSTAASRSCNESCTPDTRSP